MDPVQKWQNGLTLTDYEKQVVRNFGYNPDVPFSRGSISGTNLQGSTPNLQPAAPNTVQTTAPNVVGSFYQIPDNTTTTPPVTTTLSAFQQAMLDAQNSGGDSSGGSGGATVTPTDYGQKILPDGRVFDMNDPNQRLAYYQAIQVSLGQQRDAALAQLDVAQKTGDATNAATYQGYLTQIDQNLADVNKSAQDYATSYFRTVKDFNTGKGQGDVNRNNYFTSLSPNAFQSSQATSQDYANNQYLQGLTDLANQGQQATGLSYLNAYDPSSGISSAAFDPNSQYGQNVSSINAQKTNLGNSFNAYNEGQMANLKTNQSAIGQQYNDALAAQKESLGQVDLAQNTNPFQYGLQSTTPYQASTPSVSTYTPYTNFGSLADTSIPGSTYKAPAVASNAFSQPTLDTWLGRTNTNLPAPQKNAWFNNFLMGKVTA